MMPPASPSRANRQQRLMVWSSSIASAVEGLSIRNVHGGAADQVRVSSYR